MGQEGECHIEENLGCRMSNKEPLKVHEPRNNVIM